MNKIRFVKLWIDVLRSNQYKKTFGYLRTDYGFCALGIACDLYHKLINKLDIVIKPDSYYYNEENQLLPDEVSTFLQLTEVDEDRIVVANDLESDWTRTIEILEELFALKREDVKNEMLEMQSVCD